MELAKTWLGVRPTLKTSAAKARSQAYHESEVEAIVLKLAEARWPWRIHATYDESIDRFLNIFERVHREHPIDQLRWFIDHAENS